MLYAFWAATLRLYHSYNFRHSDSLMVKLHLFNPIVVPWVEL
jgi:hypothetical protein